MLEDHLYPFSVGESFDLLEKIDPAVINHLISAQLTGTGKFFIAAGRSNHSGTRELCDLHPRAPHSAAGCEDQHVFSRFHLGLVDQHVPCSDENQKDTSPLFKGKVRGHGNNVVPRHRRILGISAVTDLPDHTVLPAQMILAPETHLRSEE